MTTNIERVAEVMKTHGLFFFNYGDGWFAPQEEVIRCSCGEEFYSYIQTGDGSGDDDRDPDTLYRQHLAQALADAGLLMPDLPEPEFKFSGGACWLDSGNASVESHHYSDSHVYVITASIAYALLAAVNHAEKGHTND